MYSVSLLSMLNARENLRLQAEKLGHNSLPNLRTSNSVSRRSMRAIVEAMVRPFCYPLFLAVRSSKHLLNSTPHPRPDRRVSVTLRLYGQQPAREIVVEIRRDTKITFEGDGDGGYAKGGKGKGKTRHSYRFQLSQPTSPADGLTPALESGLKASGSDQSNSGSSSQGYAVTGD